MRSVRLPVLACSLASLASLGCLAPDQPDGAAEPDDISDDDPDRDGEEGGGLLPDGSDAPPLLDTCRAVPTPAARATGTFHSSVTTFEVDQEQDWWRFNVSYGMDADDPNGCIAAADVTLRLGAVGCEVELAFAEGALVDAAWSADGGCPGLAEEDEGLYVLPQAIAVWPFSTWTDAPSTSTTACFVDRAFSFDFGPLVLDDISRGRRIEIDLGGIVHRGDIQGQGSLDAVCPAGASCPDGLACGAVDAATAHDDATACFDEEGETRLARAGGTLVTSAGTLSLTGADAWVELTLAGGENDRCVYGALVSIDVATDDWNEYCGLEIEVRPGVASARLYGPTCPVWDPWYDYIGEPSFAPAALFSALPPARHARHECFEGFEATLAPSLELNANGETLSVDLSGITITGDVFADGTLGGELCP